MTCLFPSEIDMDHFTILDPIKRGMKSWSSKILYKKETLKIQTPEMLLAFDLNPYTYNDSQKKNYSLCVSLDEKINGMKLLKKLLNDIDNTTKNTFTEEAKTCTFVSSSKKPKDDKFAPLLRCKMVSNQTRFKCLINQNGKPITDKIDEVKKRLKKGTKVQLVLQLNPVWKVDNRFGVSWQILAIDIIKPLISFRNNQFTSE